MYGFFSDDPVRDAEEYAAYCEQQQAAWEERCEKCEICGKPLDPHFSDTEWCYEDGETRICKDCYEKNIKKVEKLFGSHSVFFAMIYNTMDTIYVPSPVPND